MSLTLILAIILAVIVYPGLIFCLTAGSGLLGLREQMVSRAEGRRGQPMLQPFYDMGKLLVKERLGTSPGEDLARLAIPAASIAVSATLMILLPLPGNPVPSQLAEATGLSYRPDILTTTLLLETAGALLAIAGFATRSKYSWIAALRKAQASLMATFPWLLAIVALTLAARSMNLFDINFTGDFTGLLVKIGAAIVLLLSLPGRLGIGPFSSADAAAEIAGGPDIEYCGIELFMYKAAQRIYMIALISFIFVLLVPIGAGFVTTAPLYIIAIIGIGAMLGFIESGTGRLKLAAVSKFYWMNLMPVAVVLTALAGYSAFLSR